MYAYSENPDLKLGMIFNSKKEAKFAIESHCIRRGMVVNFVKNDKSRLRGVCKNEGCEWVIHVSPVNKDSCWQIKTFKPEHKNCYWNVKNKNIKSSWLGETFVSKLKSNPKLGTRELREEVKSTLNVSLTYKQAYLGRKKALKLVDGSIAEQFSQIRNYCAELRRSDEGASVILKLTDGDDAPRFQRLYVCFSACKQGFKESCRPVVGVDGCFLKTNIGGQLLTAVGLDPNNNIFPIAYALVEGETKDSWMWFLQLLNNDIGFENEDGWTFMSDKQKGLIPAFENLFPNAENRFCVRHLYTNMKHDGFRGVGIKNALWAAARATRVEEFKRRMEDLKKINHDAYIWLSKKPEQHWFKAYFSTIPKCDILLNNMCECFNSMILDAREKPIISMFETLRNLLMVRFQTNREKAEKWDGVMCPKIKVVLAKNSKEAAVFSPLMADETHFQITGLHQQHSVDLCRMTCSCRKWDLTGIPCAHAVCAIWCKQENPEDYVHRFYSVLKYKQCYSRSIMPINGPALWPECQFTPPLPPIYKEKVGRPAKLRRRQPDEVPASRQSKLKGVKRNNKCRTCGGFGHNQMSCNITKASGLDKPTQENNEMDRGQIQTPQNYNEMDIGDIESAPQTCNEAEFVATGQGNTTSDESEKFISNKTVERGEAAFKKRKKLQVVRQQESGVTITGSSNRISSVNVEKVLNKQTHVIVKGGRNFVTVSSLRASLDDQRKKTPIESNGSRSMKDAAKENGTGSSSKS
ncbi:uncharacterized protein LOC142522108 [Primulina tabacum]|uniref:uncharacterized protein LOC142522108 n=1 Tax=Primulina tabacum TaxID=48773 RepID=UPI003F5A04D6